MEFPIVIYQLRPQMETWARFIYKASRGSDDANYLLNLANLTFVAEHLGKNTDDLNEITVEVFEDELARLIPAELPFRGLKDFLLRLHQWGCISASVQTRIEPFHERGFYADLWSKSLKVDETELTYDAAAHCFNHWSLTEYSLLTEATHQADYNSQDVVAAMLFLITGRELSRAE